MTVPLLYTPEEVAEKLKVTRRSVYTWLKDGKLRGLRAGDTWRVTDQDLMVFLENKTPDSFTLGPDHPDYERWKAYFQSVSKPPRKKGRG